MPSSVCLSSEHEQGSGSESNEDVVVMILDLNHRTGNCVASEFFVLFRFGGVVDDDFS